MKQNKVYIIISLGILFGAFFPLGIYTLIFKILERVLFTIEWNTFLASGIAAYAAALFTVFSFSQIMDYLIQFDYSHLSEVKKVFWLGVLANVGLYLVWFLIPIIDGRLGADYMANLHRSYELLNSNVFLGSVLINQGSAFLCFISIVIIIYRKIISVGSTV
ncbi:MAG: hypothetical protein WBM92_09740 [Aureibaculum sp.]